MHRDQLDAPTGTDRLDGDCRICEAAACTHCAAPTYYTIPEVCERIRLGRTTIYGYLGDELPVTRFGKRVVIHRDDLARFCEAHRSEPTNAA